MSLPKWQSGKIYKPGDLVQPARQAGPTYVAPLNPDFEEGDTGWTKGGSWAINNNPGYSGSWCAQFPGTGTGELINNAEAPISPGQTVTASCMCKPSTGSDAARAKLYWYDASHAMISASDGSLVQGSGGWRQSSVQGRAPANAAFVRLGVSTSKSSGTVVSADRFTWTLPYPERAEGLIYKAVQPTAGTSGATEPEWPPTLGVRVNDNEVIWEAVLASRIVYRAHPILTSGATEPDWPTVAGEFVSDNTISWEAISRRVEDEKCPQSKVVAIMSGKVFAADGDIVRFSATANPLDWSSADDAGYLPTGLQQANGNDMAVLAPYRSNLAAFNASSFQMWQVDPDPAAMALLDQMEGIGSTWHRAAQPVGDELFFLSQLGVRTVGIAAGSTNLRGTDVGSPVDSLVQYALDHAVAAGKMPIATYYPSAGQYWLCFAELPPYEIGIVGEFDLGIVGEPYFDSFQALGGYPPLTWTADGLPAPFAMATNSNTTGTPTEAGSWPVTVNVQDRYGKTASADRTLTVVNAPPWVGVNGAGQIYLVPEGTKWDDMVTHSALFAPEALLSDGRRIVAWQDAVVNFSYSDDIGASWIKFDTEFAPRAEMTYAAGVWLAIDLGTSHGIWRSLNGRDWTKVSASYGTNVCAMPGLALSYYAGSSSPGTVQVSTGNFTSWANGTNPFDDEYPNPVRMATDGEVIAIVGVAGGDLQFATTANGTSWAVETLPAPDGTTTPAKLAFVRDGWVLAMANGEIYYKRDGESWAKSAYVMPGGCSWIAYDGKQIVAVGGEVARCTDGGETWTPDASAPSTFTAYMPVRKPIYRSGAGG